MIYVGIDVAKNKHDCVFLNEKGEIIFDTFTIENNKYGFDKLYKNILSVKSSREKVKIGLEATGHYAYNILGYLLKQGFEPYIFNPLYTSLFRKGINLRKTKTDKIDSMAIAKILMSNTQLKPYSKKEFENEDLKSLTRYRFKMISERAKLRQSVSRLVVILFPELEKLVSTLHLKLIYAILSKYSSVKEISKANTGEIAEIIYSNSNGYHKEKLATAIINAAKKSIGSDIPAKFLELKHTINLIKEFTKIIKNIEHEIFSVMQKNNSTITTIPGVGETMSAMIISEIGDISNFSSPDKILAFSGLSPSTYQSGELYSSYAKMEKRGSKYLRYALFNASKLVCRYEPTFKKYLAKKRKEGKHYYVAISHAAKKLVRLIYHLEKNNEVYKIQNQSF